MNSPYFRPLVQNGPDRPPGAQQVSGGACWFTHVEKITRNQASSVIPATEVPTDILERITKARAPMCGLSFAAPVIMGILNVTPDSFSDGGQFNTPDGAIAQARRMAAQGADILDIGGESTRPNADTVSTADEISRTSPVISAIRTDLDIPISIDTRKAAVARVALEAGAGLINDVAAFTYDPALAALAAQTDTPVCLMHAQGDPKTMQDAPEYADVLLDVYDFLEARIKYAEAAGIARARIMIDPGIGFGKTTQHCLELLQGISLFHSLGCVILLGVSRKRFIGEIASEASAQARAPGSIAVGLAALGQGVHVLRVHDVAQTKQAVDLWQAVNKGIL